VKIAIVSNTSWSIYNFRLGLIKFLRKRNFDVEVIAPRDRFSAKLVSEGIPYHNVQFNTYSYSPFHDISTLFQLIKVYKKYKYDFVIHYTIKPNLYGTIAATLVRIPSICVTTGLGQLFQGKRLWVEVIVKILYWLVGKLTRKIGFLNVENRDEFIRRKLIRKEKTFILPGEGIDCRNYRNKSFADFVGESHTSFLFAGRILWEKGISSIYEAAKVIKKSYPMTRFNLLGFIDPANPDGVPFEVIEKWQREGIIEYLGETEDVRPYLLETSCVLFPSTYGEGISRLLLEAACTGVPIITTNQVGCRDVVEHGVTGYLGRPGSTTDLINNIELFISQSASERYKMGLNARRKTSELFDSRLVNQKYLNLLNREIGDLIETLDSDVEYEKYNQLS